MPYDQGWQCPNCKRIWAPHANECVDCNVAIDKMSGVKCTCVKRGSDASQNCPKHGPQP